MACWEAAAPWKAIICLRWLTSAITIQGFFSKRPSNFLPCLHPNCAKPTAVASNIFRYNCSMNIPVSLTLLCNILNEDKDMEFANLSWPGAREVWLTRGEPAHKDVTWLVRVEFGRCPFGRCLLQMTGLCMSHALCGAAWCPGTRFIRGENRTPPKLGHLNNPTMQHSWWLEEEKKIILCACFLLILFDYW